MVNRFFGSHLIVEGWGQDTPVVPEATDVQTTLPTSAFGQTIPVVWGKARLPGSYIWTSPIVTETKTVTQWWDTTTVVTSTMTARLRFARPLVPDSSWTLRRFWGNGKLIYDASQAYRAPGLSFTFYEGLSTQGRDPSQVAEEGEENVSAHRGYLDIVVRNFDIYSYGAPPTFEAEFVQDGASSHQYTNFTVSGGTSVSLLTFDWSNLVVYGLQSSPRSLHWFSTATKAEFYSVPVSAISDTNYRFGLRYIPSIGCAVLLSGFIGIGDVAAKTFNPTTGSFIDTIASVSGTGTPSMVCLSAIGSGAVYFGAMNSEQLFAYHIDASGNVSRSYQSVTSWQSYTSIQCIAPGEVRAAEVDFWICADADLVKVTLTSLGTFKRFDVVATFSDDLRYAVYDDGFVVAWTDNQTVARINAATGDAIYNRTVPYQIGVISTRDLGEPDQQRFVDDLYFTDGSTSYFTSLSTGETRTIAGASGGRAFYYDGQRNIIITTNTSGVPQAVRIISDDGTARDLSDFLEDLMIYGGGYEDSQVSVLNVDDVIEGVVIDLTAGAREVARSIADPYSISIFERSGTVIFKRALTDGSFAVDATASSTGDFIDIGGQAIKAQKANPEEFVSRYGIAYRDPDAVYQQVSQFGEIPTLPLPVAPADQSVKATLPIIVDADTIKTLATQKVNRMAAERHEFTTSVRSKFLDLEPEDIITFPFAGRTITARITEGTIRPDYAIDLKATEFLTKIDAAISGSAGNPIPPDPVGTPESRYYHLDIPLLSDDDDLAGDGLVQYHVLASLGQPYWDGATLFRKDTLGTYQAVAQQRTNGIAGIALEELPDWDIPYVTEFSRTIKVAFLSGDASALESVTYQELCEGANMFAIGAPGRWEVCHVQTVTSNGDGTYTFETLRRGRDSSEEFTGLHETGDYVVWLGTNVQHLDYAVANLDDVFSFKPVGYGDQISNVAAVSRTVTGEAEKIPKPANLTAEVDGSDIDLGWNRRSRIGAYWSDDGDYTTPLGESLEQYVVRIKDGPAGTVLRTYTVNDATAKTYPSADITTDFGSIPDQLTFDVRQVSGAGVICPTREATIDL